MSAGSKLTILFLAANPVNTEPLQLDRELRGIKTALQLSPFRDRFKLEVSLATRLEDMRRAMLSLQPQIVHFAGHGGEGAIYLEDENGKAYTVASGALSRFFAIFPSVQCVVLNACYSDELGGALAEHVPYVVGMQVAVQDPAAIIFAEAFYDAVGAGQPYDTAFTVAYNALDLKNMVEAAMPVLKQGKAPIKTPSAKPIQIDRLTGAQFKQLHEAMTFAYTEESLTNMVQFVFNQPLAAVAGGSNRSAIVFNLIDWAQRTGRLSALIQGAVEHANDNQALKTFVDSLQ